MADEKAFIEYINKLQTDIEDALDSAGALYTCVVDDIEWQGRRYNILKCYSDLGMIYKYQGYTRKADRMFSFYLTLADVKRNYFGYAVDYLGNDIDDECNREISRCIMMYFGHRPVDEIAAQLNNVIKIGSSDDLSAYRKTVYMDKVGFVNLWMGYAHLLLGNHEKALLNLKETIACYEKYRKSQGIWQKAESYLPKALMPIIEYKLIPTEIMRNEARSGLEEFIGFMRDDARDGYIRKDLEKLEGYKYYFHLRESFPEIFS